MSFWSIPHRTRDGNYFQITFMSGAGGNTIFIAPNGVSTFVLTDHGMDSYSPNCPAVAESIRPFPENGIRLGLMLAGKGVWLIPENQQKIQLINYFLLSWLILTIGLLGYILLDIVPSTSAHMYSKLTVSKLTWFIAALLFGPLTLVTYLYFHKRSRRTSAREINRTN